MASLPLDVEQRLRTRFGRIGPDLFMILAEAQEHGATFLNTVLTDDNGRQVRLIVADPKVQVVDDTPVLAGHV